MTEQISPKIVIGLMSGTSADSIDACLVKVFPDFSYNIIETFEMSYPENIREIIFRIFNNKTSVEEICQMNFIIGEYFASAALEVIKKAGINPADVDLVSSHGQTIFHKPDNEFINGFSTKSTLQIGEGSIIAERTGITTISDFRTADIAAGGQGAPLVCFADNMLFRSDSASRAIQNIGGMANVTVISPFTEVFAFDTGPGNVLIDMCAEKYFNQKYDAEGLFASQGNIDEHWLNSLLQEKYYSLKPPKTTGRELFSAQYFEEMLINAPQTSYDIIATVTELTAKTIFDAYTNFIFPKTKIDELILGGGGAYNPILVNSLKKHFGNSLKVLTHKDFGISDSFKEALAFAFLGYATYYRIPNNIPSCTGASHSKVLGKISFP